MGRLGFEFVETSLSGGFFLIYLVLAGICIADPGKWGIVSTIYHVYMCTVMKIIANESPSFRRYDAIGLHNPRVFFEKIEKIDQRRTHMKVLNVLKGDKKYENPSKIESNNTAIDDMQ